MNTNRNTNTSFSRYIQILNAVHRYQRPNFLHNFLDVVRRYSPFYLSNANTSRTTYLHLSIINLYPYRFLFTLLSNMVLVAIPSCYKIKQKMYRLTSERDHIIHSMKSFPFHSTPIDQIQWSHTLQSIKNQTYPHILWHYGPQFSQYTCINRIPLRVSPILHQIIHQIYI